MQSKLSLMLTVSANPTTAVRDPLEQLGAGPSDSAFSMEAVRVHPFFASIHWDRLWDDPAPPLEMGLIRCEAAPVDEWDDVGATWDELVSGSEAEDEKMGAWRNYIRIRIHMVFVSPLAIPPEEIGPHGEIPGYAPEAFS
ncbi:hypothetical protein BGW80DRAFT_1460194 [Lactifluus volemus]|nr:hypothetical protein BGW80DRAFT_1460194 [Lactifluus volemus]